MCQRRAPVDANIVGYKLIMDGCPQGEVIFFHLMFLQKPRMDKPNSGSSTFLHFGKKKTHSSCLNVHSQSKSQHQRHKTSKTTRDWSSEEVLSLKSLFF